MTQARFSFRLLPILMALFLVFSGCDSNGDGDGDGDGNPFGSGSMEATIDGNSFDAVVVVAVRQGTVVSVTGNLGASVGGSQEQISITVANASESSFQVSAIGAGATAIYAGGSLAGVDAFAGTSGTVTIDNLTDDGVSGTFSFTAQNNAQEQVQVTGGEFSATFSN